MRANPLRAEFLLTGFATLLSLLLLAEAIHGLPGAHLGAIDAWRAEHERAGVTVGDLGIVIGVSYVLGIVVVQLTFFFPTEGMIRLVRTNRMADLTELDDLFVTWDKRVGNWTEPAGRERKRTCVFPVTAMSDGRAAGVPVDLSRGDARAILPLAFGVRGGAGRRSFLVNERRLARDRRKGLRSDPVRHAQTLALTLGRALASEEIAEEYKYRRANRQIFVGILPAAVFTCVAATVAACGKAPDLPAIAVGAVVTVVVLWWLLESAFYQERIAQSLIVDVAFLTRWGVAVSGPPTSGGSEVEDELEPEPAGHLSGIPADGAVSH